MIIDKDLLFESVNNYLLDILVDFKKKLYSTDSRFLFKVISENMHTLTDFGNRISYTSDNLEKELFLLMTYCYYNNFSNNDTFDLED